jgi:hypothetical protein
MGLVQDPMAAVEVVAAEAETVEGAKVVAAVVMVPVHPATVAGTTTIIATGVASGAIRPGNSPKRRSKLMRPKRRSLHFFLLRSKLAAVAVVMSLGEAMIPAAAGLPQGRPLSSCVQTSLVKVEDGSGAVPLRPTIVSRQCKKGCAHCLGESFCSSG